jgi:hypothetical protein
MSLVVVCGWGPLGLGCVRGGGTCLVGGCGMSLAPSGGIVGCVFVCWLLVSHRCC